MKKNGGCFCRNKGNKEKFKIINMIKQSKTHDSSFLVKFSPVPGGLFLLCFLIVSLWLIFEYAEKERNRDLVNWQIRLSLLAEIRADSIEGWIGKRKIQLHKLANNPSLKLFLSQLANKDKADKSVLNAQQGHVRNLLRASADRFGFAEDLTVYNQLNLNKSSEYGLAILGMQQQLVMSTKGFPKDLTVNKRVIEKTYSTAKAQIIDLYAGENKQPVYGYIIPVFQIQNLVATSPIGAVMLLLNPQKNLYGILQNKQSVTSTDESLLVKQNGASLVYISPVKGGFKLFHQLPDKQNQLAASYALHHPGGFSELIDYQGESVLVTGRKIKNSQWSLVQKISSAEALAESDKHQSFLLTTLILFVLMVAAAFIAIWRHSTSIRLQVLSRALETRTALLDAVTDNIQENIILLDSVSRVIFINPAFATELKIDAEEVELKKISSVLGKDASEQLLVNAYEENHASVKSFTINETKRTYHVTFTTLKTGEHKNAKLFVLHDISELKDEQEKREQLGRGIIATLVKAVDLHDPYCVNHSGRTRDVAMAIALEMELSEAQLESLEMASLLANIGKLFVPSKILTKMEPLTEEESIQLKKHIEFAVDILSELPFKGPVVDIISQKSERLDGSGYPDGLTGSEIMLESRILSVANAFVAMASSRAYREGREVKQVIDVLLEQSDTQFDRHVVAALFHISENKAAWKTWQSI
jgi:HD-GYP domain-containing protein (c-di-GMP phosphodiesterase class II)